MKGKQLAILLLLVAVLGGAWYLVSSRNRASWSEAGGGGGKVVEFPINDVARLVIKSPTGELNLVKKADAWTVQERADYPASFQQVSDLLRKLWELKTVQEVKAGPSQLPRLQLVEPGKGDSAGTLIQFQDKDGKPLAGLLVGKQHMRKVEGGESGFHGGSPEGRYVKSMGGAKVSLVSDPLDDADPSPQRWLDKDFIKILNPKSIAVAGPTEAQRWTITREKLADDWKLADAKPDEKADTGKASAVGSNFADPSFTDLLAADAKPEETGLDKPTTAIIETFDGFRYELKIGKEKDNSHPVQLSVTAALAKERTPAKDEKPEDKPRLDEEFAAKQKALEAKLAKEKKLEGRTFLIGKFVIEPLLKDRVSLFPDKPEDPAATSSAPGAPNPVDPHSAHGHASPVPPVSVTTPPITVPPVAPKLEAVTPPVQVPPPAPAPPPDAAPEPAKPDAAQ